MPVPDSIDVQRLLATGRVAEVEYFQTVGSTQDHAIGRARTAGTPLPLLVVAERQTAGRGRGQNRWWTGAGSLAFSVVFDAAGWSPAAELQPVRALAVGAAIVETLRPYLGQQRIGLHWPNDVFVGERKIAGILVDVLAGGLHVVGVGINVNNRLAAAPDEVRSRATSLCDLTARQFDRTDLLADLLGTMHAALGELAAGPETYGARFSELCLQAGRTLCVESGGRRTTGRCAGIATDGALLLETDAGLKRLYSGVLR